MKKVIWLLLLLALPVSAQENKSAGQETRGHDYAPLREAALEIKDFSFPTLDQTTLNLREAARGKKLILVHYFATWCHSSNFDVATVKELYEKYKDQGLAVVAVSQYSTPDDLRSFIAQHKLTYPICYEGEGKRKDRTNSTHYRYRKKLDDQRSWGTPFSVLLSAADLTPEGETIAKRVRAATGELVKADVEQLIREQLQAQ